MGFESQRSCGMEGSVGKSRTEIVGGVFRVVVPYASTIWETSPFLYKISFPMPPAGCFYNIQKISPKDPVRFFQ